ncbi:hypothetical protein H4R20_000127 [Coemansia guatemalensis]|uniref:Uncharacterized protein n=1 Tax=Coemansia guatemalensis TaxID=2761395 RepID=A0A9W8HZT6_9FUNG|nr:hypothetical protein H4R20_000127 [Coemansia guatemalensis]
MFRLLIRRGIGQTRYSTQQKPTVSRWKRFLGPVGERPISHITAFGILHEVTAIVPLVGFYFMLSDSNQRAVFPDEVLEESNRYINKLRGYVGLEPIDKDSLVLARLTTSYIMVKFLAPARVLVSLALTPATAKWCVVPVTDVMRRIYTSVLPKRKL